ncbi:MAG TPA: CheR family methyltransferase [Methylomirabilota bacterium]|nr:CheR family methyltransferase [Methylomirabilota bacterium]
MSSSLPPSLLAHVSRLIETWMGLFFPPERWTDLERKLHAVAPALGCADAEACARLLTAVSVSQQQLDVLATYLTVGETYFFREPRSLEVLEQRILPELIHCRRGVDQHLRLWSAACCTGEEAYSLAIILHRLIPNLSEWKTTLLATDLSPRFLRKAQDGVYGQWSFRSVPAAVQERYFQQTAGGHYLIKSTLKNMVSFAQLNLATENYPSPGNNTIDMDVIFCRNVLIYFTAERIKRVLERFYHALVDGGWLVVSPVESAFVMDSPFTPVQFPGVTLFRKDLDQRATRAPLAPVIAPETRELRETPPLVLAADGEEPSASFSDCVPLGADGALLDNAPAQEPLAPSPLTPGTTLHPYEEASALYARGHYAEVIEKLSTFQWEAEQAPCARPREQAMAVLARSYANQGRLTEAQTWCERALAVNKFDAGLHYLRATILLECGQEGEARLSLTRALYLDQHFVLAHVALGNLAVQRKDAKEARKHFANALTLLHHYQPEDILPESDGMSAGKLAQIIADMSERI